MARKPARVISHWYRYVEGFSTSAMAFYASVKKAVTRRGLAGVTLSRVQFKEGGLFSARREYLRVQRARVVLDIGAAPYGRGGYFFSWRLAELPRHPLGMPVAWLWERIFRPRTYYELDTALVFRKAVQASINEILEGLLSQQGLRALQPAPGPFYDPRRPPKLSDIVSLRAAGSAGRPAREPKKSIEFPANGSRG